MTAALEAVVRAAVSATGARAGCVFATEGTELVVVAVAGEAPGSLEGRRAPAAGSSAGLVVASGQPMAVAVRPGSATTSTLAELAGRPPTSILSVPCTADDDTVGALELVDRAGGMFSIDDVELATLLAGIAGPALAESGGRAAPVPSPDLLAGELSRLADADPARYGAVATVLGILLDRG